MNKVKYTGANIAAAALILFYFFSWVSLIGLSLSGFSITTSGVSPGMLSYFISGFPRLFMVLAILVPASGAIILYQNITGNKKFQKFYKPAHVIPALYLILGIVGLYFKMKPEAASIPNEDAFNQMSNRYSDMAPGAFDVLSFGVYICLAAAIYLLLVSLGKIKDKEYYKPTPPVNTPSSTTTTTSPSDNTNVPLQE